MIQDSILKICWTYVLNRKIDFQRIDFGISSYKKFIFFLGDAGFGESFMLGMVDF